MKKDYNLAQIKLFTGLSPEHLDNLAAIAVESSCQRGEMVFHEGDEGNGFYLILSGQIKVFKVSLDGKEQILHILGPGEPFAEVAVFAGIPFPANAMALQKSKLLFLPRQDFSELLARHPSLAMNLLATLSMRLRQFTHMIEALSLKEVPGRLAAYLLIENEHHQTKSFKLPITKGQLASLLGTSPETMSRILGKIATQGLIASEGSQITILDHDGLQNLADGEVKLS